jgi:hypothetical protein
LKRIWQISEKHFYRKVGERGPVRARTCIMTDGLAVLYLLRPLPS